MELTEHNQELYKIRHSLAHILAQAVLEIQPDAELGFGPLLVLVSTTIFA